MIELIKALDVWFLNFARYFTRLIKHVAIKADSLNKNRKS